jgi:hypothetical protein
LKAAKKPAALGRPSSPGPLDISNFIYTYTEKNSGRPEITLQAFLSRALVFIKTGFFPGPRKRGGKNDFRPAGPTGERAWLGLTEIGTAGRREILAGRGLEEPVG